jgi:hypothetical protein
MPKNKKTGKKENENFDDMLAEFRAADLASTNSAASLAPAKSTNYAASNSSIAGAGARASMASLPSPSAANVARRNVSEKAIIDACLAGNLAQLQQWGRQGVRVTTAEPLLEAAGTEATFAVISYLVKELAAEFNQLGECGFAALIVAAIRGQYDTVRYLVEELGANVDIPDNLGCTPLHAASFNDHLGVVRMLLKLGAAINQRNNDGLTPLMVAASKNNTEIVKWLVKAGADTEAHFCGDPRNNAAFASRTVGASDEQTAYLEAKTHCSSPGCSGAGVMKCTGCKQARYCGEACQHAHWKAHKVDCRQ